ncbi:MAG: ferritin family protein, partial [Bacteroidales bacterium]|nr:ferritin family protein [Bacteroidales bacterium]
TIMKEFSSINDILDFAINSEQKAVDFYVSLSQRFNDKVLKEAFVEFAKEEMGHKARLTQIKETGLYEMKKEDVQDLKIADYVIRTEPTNDMSYEDALRLAMKREKAAYRLYLALAERAPNDGMKNLFNGLAQEEAKHKLRFEIEYDDYILREN